MSIGCVRRVLIAGVLLACVGAAAGGGNPAAARMQRMLTTDQQQITQAQGALDTASKALADATEKRLRDFEHSPELKAAQKAVDEGVNNLEATRRSVLETLRQSPAYTEASAKLAVAKAKAADLTDRGASAADIAGASKEVDRLDALINALEQSALAGDATIKTARETLAAASNALKTMKDKFAADGASDSTLASLKQARDDAQKKLTAAQDKMEADRTKMASQGNRGG
ncbi:MAG TPA: hypothetical protein VH253_06935 [Phycisphaerae bacterium]|nr:hypothetical protein [Phycisphaerae bacterium]